MPRSGISVPRGDDMDDQYRTHAPVRAPSAAPAYFADVPIEDADRHDSRPTGAPPDAREQGTSSPDPRRSRRDPQPSSRERRSAARDPRPDSRTPRSSASSGGVHGRRTVTITGQGAEGYASRNGTRPSSAARHRQAKRHEREGFRPDRAAMWAVLLGVMLIAAAATSAHAATLAVHASKLAGLH
jgi:hypothetical protein